MARRLVAAVAATVRANWTPETQHQVDAVGRLGIARRA
jgi:hypothetical protein